MGSCGRGRGAGRRVFNVLTTSYLFLGGTGAGALAVLCVLECARVLRWRALAMPEEFFARAWPVCAVTLATGMLSLLADLGRPDRLLGLLSSPTPSAMAAGSFALVAALACAAAFSLGALLDTVRLPRAAVLALAAAGALSAAVTATYTGALLQSLASVLLWRTSLVPVLFVLSSASCGIATAFLAASFVETRHPYRGPLVWLARIDGGIVVVEAGCLRSCCSRSRARRRPRLLGRSRSASWRPCSGACSRCAGWPCRWCWSASSRMGTAARSFCG